MIWLTGIIDSMGMSLSKLQEMVKSGKPGVLQSMESQELDTTEGLNNTSQGHRIISSGQEKYWTHYVGLLLLPGSASSQRNKQELSKGPL